MKRIYLTAAVAAAALLAGCQDREAANGAANSTGNTAEAAKGTIAQFAAGSADYSQFNAALKAGGLDATMGGAGPYTVFAPNNAAFDKVPAATREGLMAPAGKSQLVGLLTGHVVPGVVTAADLSAAIERGKGKATLATLGSGTLSLAKDGDAIVITDGAGGTARVVQADAIQSNGVVHGIDGVLMPAK